LSRGVGEKQKRVSNPFYHKTSQQILGQSYPLYQSSKISTPKILKISQIGKSSNLRKIFILKDQLFSGKVIIALASGMRQHIK